MIISRPLPVSTPKPLSNLSVLPSRSKSLLFENTTHRTTTVDRKYSIFSQSRDSNTPSVIEVGNSKDIVSERKVISALSEFPRESRNMNHSLNLKFMSLPLKDSRHSKSTKEYTFSNKGDRTIPSQVPPPKPQRMKGPAPLPPSKPFVFSEEQKRDSLSSENENSPMEIRQKLNLEPRDETSFEDQDSDNTMDSERCCSCSETYVEFEEIRETDSTLSYDSHLHRDSFSEKSLDSYVASQIEDNSIQIRDCPEQDHPPLHKPATSFEILKPPRRSLTDKGEKKESELCPNSETKWEDFKQVLTAVLERKQNLNNNLTEGEINKETFTCGVSHSTDLRLEEEEQLNSSKYETVHKEIIRESETLLNQLPNSEVQKNKIVLRVPSFRTTGCQTEMYRPVRRRATCSQTNFLPSYPTSTEAHPIHWKRPSIITHEMQKVSNVGSSSSSGYSSPDGGSKQASPVHSGPPSPASCYGSGTEDYGEGSNGPNVTIIEISRISPKTIRLRNRPDTASVKNRIPEMIPESPFQSTQCLDPLGLGERPKNLLAGTSPAWLHISQEDRIPRIIEAIPKPLQPNHSKQAEHSCRFEALTKHDKRERGIQPHRTNSLSLPRFMNAERTKVSRTSSFMGLTERENAKEASSNATEAYLTSLELLASHYRQQALTNAKQLQFQQQLLDQQKADLDL